MNLYKIDKVKCLGCAGCTVFCPKGITIMSNGKAKIKNSKELEKCGGEKLCPRKAIIKIEEKKTTV
ncbi:MAG TPA: 4Fe-4S ferredoxin [Candidatus Pacearchaeota archaeon]|nr:4Fe-4S ferredoxin [Candidatus Pacearchaeota archaeon]HPR79848.1 4Fe-4S ferredoxin [Candidatus Pacearchaeota archaeon]